MHGMLLQGVCFYREEGAGAYVQGDESPLDVPGFERLKHGFGEMQSGGRGGYRPVRKGIDGLVPFAIGWLGSPADIRWERYQSRMMQQFCEAQRSWLPGETDKK